MTTKTLLDQDGARAALPTPGSLLGRAMRVEVVLARIETAVAIAALAVAMLAVAASIAIRAFALPIPDTGEWAIVAMSPLTFVGAALCSHLHKHLTADIVETLPDGWLRRGLDALSSGLCFVFGAVFAVIAWDLFDYAWSSGEKLTDLGTPVAVPAGFMVAGAGLIALHGAMDVWRALAGRPPGGADPWH